ncbi:STAS domain-containing protein [bacterium]|nr:STAS domain-containing protein [bacterium]
MLRITPVVAPDEPLCLRLEGRLVGPWVAELDAAVVAVSGRAITLDLSRVQFVDGSGVALLQRLQNHGVVLQHPTCFIQELLRVRSD